MNKVISFAILAGGLLLLDSPQAAAGHKAHNEHRAPAYQHSRSHDRDQYRRGKQHRGQYRRGYRDDHHYRGKRYSRRSHMPNWLRNDRSFRYWYRHTSLRHNRALAWHVLFDIYRWEYSQPRYYRY